jgi:CRISPR/Cas system-associated exonuclease Cas4 (RecB family)
MNRKSEPRKVFTRAQRANAQNAARTDLLASLSQRAAVETAMQEYIRLRRNPFALAIESLILEPIDLGIAIVAPVAAWRMYLVWQAFATALAPFVS